MSFSKFQISFLVRIGSFLLTSLALAYSVYLYSFNITAFILLFLLLVQAFKLYQQTNKIHEYLTLFLRIVKESHDSYSMPARGTDYIFAELSLYFREISEVIKEAKIEKENQYHYLQYVIEHVVIGLLAFDEKDKVELFNNAGKKLLGLPNLLNIKTLDATHEGFYQTLKDLSPGEQKSLVVNINNELLHLSLKCAQFKMWDKKIKLVSFQNIKTELDEKELDSWQKLIRILNHEIMNSITPITTLTASIKKTLLRDTSELDLSDSRAEVIEETVKGLSIIENRGKGLIDFVNKYRNLSKAMKPNIEKINVVELLYGVEKLMQPDMEKSKIELTLETSSENIIILADRKLIEQVVINLLKNSIQALQRKREKHIRIRAELEESHTVIKVTDNGKGIQKEELDNIFVPFYTTKEQGSGIGLSLSRQIMRLHKGSISVNSLPGEFTTFTLTF